MKKIKLYVTLLIMIIGILLIIYRISSNNSDIHQVRLTVEKIPKDYFDHALNLPAVEKNVLTYLMKKMSSSDMEIYTNYKDREGGSDTIATGQDVLSESQGLFLQYLVNRDEKRVFDAALNTVIEDYWLSSNTISWIKRKNGSISGTNALIDDLRIARSTILANDRWQDANYRKVSKAMSSGLLKHSIKKGIPVDFYNRDNNSQADFVTISYLDLYTMKRLKDLDSNWGAIYQKSVEIVKNAKYKNTGLYQFQYDIKGKKYNTPDSISLIQSVYTILHLAEEGYYDYEGIEWIYNEFSKNNKLYETYSASSQLPATQVESTALYALLARVYSVAGQQERAQFFLKQCEKFQVTDPRSEIYGSFGNDNTREVYSFDNLLYLLSSSIIQKK